MISVVLLVVDGTWEHLFHSLFVRLISYQPAVLFSQNKPATSNQPTVLFSQNKSAPAISHQPNEQAVRLLSEVHFVSNLYLLSEYHMLIFFS
jgi:hypothetical protein